jgi:Uma2 family endonuclease
MLTTTSDGEQRVLLRNISWQLYENLLSEIGDDGVARLSYFRGDLEFMSPLPEHENHNRLIEKAIGTVLEELDLDYNVFGSMTIKRPDLAAGKEPDSCYYIAHELAVRGKTKLDFTQDPPPDLAVEIDITSSSINQLSLYAALGVTEVWRYDGQTLAFYHLKSGQYVPVDRSPALPILSPDLVLLFLEECRTQGVKSAVKSLRHWIANRAAKLEINREDW